MVGADKCPNERAQHGPAGAGCLWQVPSPYWVLKPMDMRRIFLKHYYQCIVHASLRETQASKVELGVAGVCPSERVEHGPVGTN